MKFDSIKGFHYKCHETSLNHCGFYIDSSELLKKWKKHYESKKQRCFKYSVTDTINHENIGKHPERISDIRPFIDQYDWKAMNFPIWSKDWKRFETNNKAIAVLFLPSNSDGLEKIRQPTYENNSERENQVIILMITSNEKWHYLAVKSLSILLHGIMSKHNDDHYCINCLHSLWTESTLK